ncbi:MAG: hypothetical protein JXA33_01640 [Anaerolineae bacterium]|nr:hypothetical protein [Anaerolineae bacterium]
MGNPRTLIYGQKLHRDLEWNFSFWRPLNWQSHTLTQSHGVIYYPETDLKTGFYVTVTDLSEDLDTEITTADLPALREGLQEGLVRLPACKLLAESEITKEKAMGFDFLFTFALDDAVCKRRMRTLYLGRCQYTLYGQGVPPEEYDVFQNIFDYMYLTFTFRDLALDMGVPPMPDFTKPYIH